MLVRTAVHMHLRTMGPLDYVTTGDQCDVSPLKRSGRPFQLEVKNVLPETQGV